MQNDNTVPSNSVLVVAEMEACLYLSTYAARDDMGISCIVLQQDSILDVPITFIAKSGLEVVNPANVKATLVLWEFTNGQDYQDVSRWYYYLERYDGSEHQRSE